MTKRELIGKAGEYRVLSELLVRGINACPVIVEEGGDLILRNGKIIQVRTKEINHLGGVGVVLTKSGGYDSSNYDYLIVYGRKGNWVDRKTDEYFYIIPSIVVDGLKSVYLNPKKKEFEKFLNNWELLSDSKIKRSVVLNRKVISGIVKQPTPEEDRIAKEKKSDYSLGGVLKKTKDEKSA